MENLYFLVETKLHHMDGSTALMREVRPVSTEFPPTHYSVISEVITAVADLHASVNPSHSYNPTIGEWGAWVDKKGEVKFEVCNVEDVTGRMDDELDSICRVEEIVVPAPPVVEKVYHLVDIEVVVGESYGTTEQRVLDVPPELSDSEVEELIDRFVRNFLFSDPDESGRWFYLDDVRWKLSHWNTVPAHAVESAHKYNLVSIRYYE